MVDGLEVGWGIDGWGVDRVGVMGLVLGGRMLLMFCLRLSLSAIVVELVLGGCWSCAFILGLTIRVLRVSLIIVVHIPVTSSPLIGVTVVTACVRLPISLILIP